ncbi:PD-(D/E)XK nuclease family protein [Hazenella coriacea]|uniref:ATP-dependent helicase/DNAse subunit B n=1 Tax=Hazenella coriacea TaxID=1179467 RepID=A0A4R3L748_9BACL|nr:PD-(D/E)XK nuclease family protein [Hazenella coriacea]TCS94918.1 ATP-dependent helicase/DNAse subunit B [Hazenella coriacea]
MLGKIYLHPVSQAFLGMGYDDSMDTEEIKTVYILPSHRQVRDLRKKVQAKHVQWRTFDQFVREISQQDDRHFLSPVEQHWIVQQVVAELESTQLLTYFSSLIGETDQWIHSIEKVIGELKRAGVLPARLSRLWSGKGDKWVELAIIYDRYQAYLDQYRLTDHEQPYLDIMTQLRTQTDLGMLPDRVVLESFYDANFLQEQLLKQLVSAGLHVELHLMWDENRPRLNDLTQPLVRRLQPLFQVNPVSRKIISSLKKESLIHLSEQAFFTAPEIKNADSTIEVIVASGIEAEVELMVTRLKRWLQEPEHLHKEVAVITTEMERYAPVLFKKLAQAGIPVRTRQTKKLSDHSLFQTVKAAFSVRMGRQGCFEPLLLQPHFEPLYTKRQETLRLYKVLGCPAQKEDLAQAWTVRQEMLLEDHLESPLTELEAFSALEQLILWLESIPERQTWLEWLDWFVDWIRPLKNKKRWQEMGKDASRLSELTAEMNGWQELRQMVQAGEWMNRFSTAQQPIDRTHFLDILSQLAEQVEVTVQPELHSGIYFLDAKRLRGDQFDVVFVLGCEEGNWPRAYSDNWLLPDQERLRLREEEVWLDLSWELRQRQLMPFFMSMLAAKQLLVFSYSTSNEDGKKQLPSSYLEEALAVFTKESLIKNDHSFEPIATLLWDACHSMMSGVQYAVFHKYQSQTQPDQSRAEQVYQTYAEQFPESWQSLLDRIQVEQERQLPTLTRFDGRIEDMNLIQKVQELLEKKVWSATELNQLVSCPFHFTASQFWGLREATAPTEGLSSLEEGNILHDVLCQSMHEFRQGDLTSLDDEQTYQRLLELVEEQVAQRVASSPIPRDPLSLCIDQHRVTQKIFSFWRHEISWRQETGYTQPPTYLELSFGLPIDMLRQSLGLLDMQSKTAPVEIPLAETRSIRLKGKIDRVDLDSEGFYAVYDYKSGNPPNSELVRSGKQLQLPLYLWALEQGFQLEPEKAMGASFYTAGKSIQSKDNRNTGLWRKELAHRIGISNRVGSRLDEHRWQEVQDYIRHRILEKVEQIEQGFGTVEPLWPDLDCQHCAYRTICRVSEYVSSKGKEDLEK